MVWGRAERRNRHGQIRKPNGRRSSDSAARAPSGLAHPRLQIGIRNLVDRQSGITRLVQDWAIVVVRLKDSFQSPPNS